MRGGLQPDYEVVIVGAGLTGASLACALGRRGIRAAVLDARPPRIAACGEDERGIALSLSSQRIYAALGLWPRLDGYVTPIERIHVSEKGRFQKARFSADGREHWHGRHSREYSLEHTSGHPPLALGYVVIARQLGNVLLQEIERWETITMLPPAAVVAIDRHADHVAARYAPTDAESNSAEATVTARLLVAADGADSPTAALLGIRARVKDYAQRAYVTHVTPERPHRNTAYERFTPEGSVALLPSVGGRCVAIYVAAEEETKEAADEFSPPRLLEKIQHRFGKYLGRLREPGAAQSYPLTHRDAKRQARERAVLLGNAAHTLHPNAAQGFNLCLRDAAELARTIGEERGDPGAAARLRGYCRRRRREQRKVIAFTRVLHALFHHRGPLHRLARHSIMFAIDALPPLKDYVVRQAGGLGDGRPPGA